MFGRKIKYLPKRKGERYASALTSLNLKNKVYKHLAKLTLSIILKILLNDICLIKHFFYFFHNFFRHGFNK